MKLRLLFASDLPNGSMWKIFSLKGMQLEDLNLCRKLHNYNAVEQNVHISKGCMSFVSSLYHSTVRMSLPHMHPKIKLCTQAKSPSNLKKAFILLSPLSREL